MKFFKGLLNILGHLTKEKNEVSFEEVGNLKEPQPESKPVDPPKIEEQSNLETQIQNPGISQVRDWAINKIELLHEADRHRNAKALLAEFDEWINVPEGTEELEYLCLEDEDWTDDQEVDVR